MGIYSRASLMNGSLVGGLILTEVVFTRRKDFTFTADESMFQIISLCFLEPEG